MLMWGRTRAPTLASKGTRPTAGSKGNVERTMPTLHLEKLTCIRRQDITGDDEPRLVVDGDVVWGPRKMNPNDQEDAPRERTLNIPVPFADVVEVKLQEMNADKPKQIGASQYIRVDRPGSPVEFSTSGARYELDYTVEDA
jgi:hypothetical protein